MNILITICARGGSKGIPGKNIKMLNGKPLIGLVSVGQKSAPYTIAQAQAIVDGLQDMGFSIILGVPAYWRSPGDGDCVNDSKITNLIKDVDIIMPWLWEYMTIKEKLVQAEESSRTISVQE